MSAHYASPYLPEPEPDPVTPVSKKRRARWTLALWVLLILMFLGIWQFLSPETPAHPARPSLPVCETSFWTGSFPLIVGGVVVFLLFFLFFRAYGASKGYAVEIEPASLDLAEKRFGAAAAKYASLMKPYAKKPAYLVDLTIGWAYAILQDGRLRDAIDGFVRAEKMKNILFSSGARLAAANALAFTYALSGEVGAAETWANEARGRLAKNKGQRILNAACLCRADATIAIRRGETDRAIQLLDANWDRLRYTLSGNLMRIVEVLRAFAESSRGPRGYNLVGGRLTRVEPVAPGEFDFLGVEWPEMRTFLVSHGLSRVETTP